MPMASGFRDLARQTSPRTERDMVLRQIPKSVNSIKIENCPRNVNILLSFDEEGNVVTPYGKHGDLFMYAPRDCIFKTTIHFKANGSCVECKTRCPERR